MTQASASTFVFGLAVAGRAVAKSLRDRGLEVVVGDDKLTDDHRLFAQSIGSHVVDVAHDGELQRVMSSVSVLSPAPGVPENHSVIRSAHENGVSIQSEIEIAYRMELLRGDGPRPMVAITGTDGKTTTTLMANAMLRAAGLRSEAVGNTEVPLIESLATEAQAFAIECSSFRLEHTELFRAQASAWLNIAPDHLDWHSSYQKYFDAKAKMWVNCTPSDVAVAPVDDVNILSVARASVARVVTFGAEDGDYRVVGNELCGPSGAIMNVSRMKRSLPHDVTNALAAAAVCIESGLASAQHVAHALEHFDNAPHRIQFVAEINGVRWFNDSKATSPHAASVALRAFDSIVLIAGGKNKDLDLSQMACEPHRMRAVVAIGMAADEIAQAFSGVCTVVKAESMSSAVSQAHELSRNGDVVVLSPGCTSYDWYSNYGERGDDFMNCVRELSENHH
jgi:UDP-N-acetylmuramoylalanine--D-glutamate ligase